MEIMQYMLLCYIYINFTLKGYKTNIKINFYDTFKCIY